MTAVSSAGRGAEERAMVASGDGGAGRAAAGGGGMSNAGGDDLPTPGLLRQTLRRLADRRERIAWGNRQPASHGIIIVQSLSLFGKWVATVNGAGLIASIALMIEAYTSLAGASDMCIASGFVSHTVGLAQDAAWRFAAGGVLSLVAFAAPGLIGFGRNFCREEGPKPTLHFGQELNDLTKWVVGGIYAAQAALLLLSILIVIPALDTALQRHTYTQEHIQTMWRGFEEGCKPSSPDLT
jgi:hypothetical protein